MELDHNALSCQQTRSTGCWGLRTFAHKALIAVSVSFCLFLISCSKKSTEELPPPPEPSYTLIIDKGEGLWGYPESLTFTYHTKDTIDYLYSLKLGNTNLIVTLDSVQVPDSGSFVMDKDHLLKARGENKVLWELEFDKSVYFCVPAIADDGTIYVSTGIYIWTDYGSLYAINTDGTVRWSYDLEYNAYTPVIGNDGTIYIQDFHNKTYAVTPNGTLKWTFSDFDNPMHIWYDMGQRVPAVASDGTIYVAADGLYAVNPETGARLWRFNPLPGKCCRQSPVIAEDGTIYIFIHQSDFYAVNPDGTQKWHAELETIYEQSFTCPAIDENGVIYLGAESGNGSYVYVFYPDGTRKWRYSIEGNGRVVRASPTIAADGTIYVATKAGIGVPAKLIALTPSGTMIWEYIVENVHGPGTADDVYSTPAVGSDGMIYFGAESGYFYAVNPDGTLNWKCQVESGINWSSAAIADDGTLYIGSVNGSPETQYRGNLYALTVSSHGYAQSPWPGFRQNNRNNGRYGGQ